MPYEHAQLMMETVVSKTIARFAIYIVIFITGCVSNTQEKKSAGPYPDWYYRAAEGQLEALSSANCVQIVDGDSGMARQHALDKGRHKLANEIATRIRIMDKAYDRIADHNTRSGGVFESASKKIVANALENIRSVKSARVDDQEISYICSLVSLENNERKSLLEDIIQSAKVNLTANDMHVLREQFRGYNPTHATDTIPK